MKTIVVKLGGSPSRDTTALASLSAEVLALAAEARVAIVHGGGGEVSALSERLGITPRFSDGVRMTNEVEMDLVDMVLCGVVNKRVVRALAAASVPAVGISGADGRLLTGEALSKQPRSDSTGPGTGTATRGANTAGPGVDTAASSNRTARVATVNPALLSSLWESGYVPVVASPGSDAAHGAVNINADEATFAIGSAVSADEVVFISDVPGVLDSAGEPIPELTPGRISDLAQSGAITGGMVEKLRNAVAAVGGGAGLIVIGAYDSPGALGRLIRGESGTRILGEEQ